MSSAEVDPQQLDVRYHDLNKIDCNQAVISASLVNPNPTSIAQKTTLPSTDELQLQQMNLAMKLPQRRKFITLAEANSATYGLKFHFGLEKASSLGSSTFPKALDLPLAEGQEEASKQVELPAMAKSKEEAFYEAEEVSRTKKKLLAQLAESPGAKVDSQPKFQQDESLFRRSSNPSRTCRFCGREFASGRALGGHMRVHGVLLFADTSTYTVEQEDRNHGDSEIAGSIDPIDPHLYGRRALDKMKPNSFTSSSNSSQMNSEQPNQAIKLDRYGQEDVDEEEKVDEGGEKVTRMVNLSSFECTSLVNKSGELLGCGDASFELLTGKGKHASAFYELRRNPKPNQRFFRDQERQGLLTIWQSSLAAPGAVPRSRSPSLERERACSECGKVFSSCKALFGHMRCHPEREWRGIQPPERSNELDRANRSITPKGSYAEISLAQNISNCAEPTGSALSNVDSKEKFTAKVQQDVSSKDNVLYRSTAALEATKETASSPTHKLGECLDMESRQFRDDAATVIEQAEDNIAQGPALLESKRDSTKRTTDHVANRGTKELTKASLPSWYSTGKRSKQNRSGHAYHELSSTSKATSIELRLSQQDIQLADEQEDLDMANCLVLLSSAGNIKQEIDRMRCDRTEDSTLLHQAKKRRVSLKSISTERLPRAGPGAIQADVEFYDHGHHGTATTDDDCDEVKHRIAASVVENDVKAENYESFNSTEVKYQCSTCKKCFNSHQALGGHRASHKKMKGCFAQTKNLAKEAQESSEENVTEDDLGMENIRWHSIALKDEGHINEAEKSDGHGDPVLKVSSRKSKIKGHECSICHRIFASGQALGGHKRCHWNGERYVADTASVASSNIKQSSADERSEWVSKSSIGIRQLAKEEPIDLNLPAPFDEEDESHFDSLTAPGTVVKRVEALKSLMDCSVATDRQVRTQEDWKDWITKDSFGGASASSTMLETRETEDRFGFNRRPPVWNQMWEDAAAGTQIPQVCSFDDPLSVSEKTALTTW